MNVPVSSDLAQAIDRLVADQRFSSPAEVVAEGIRLVISRERLRQEIQAAAHSLDVDGGIPAADVYRQAEAIIDAAAS